MNCKICGAEARFVFDMPASKQTGDPASLHHDGPLANFYECAACHFLFTDALDDKPHFYESEFLCTYDKEPGSDIQYMRLLGMAASMLGKHLYECRILDFGSGTGGFVEAARRYVELEVWGYDLALGPQQHPYILKDLSNERFDIVVAREVVEHFTDPLGSFRQMRAALKQTGVLTFQTNLYRPGEYGRDWDYIGVNNGHISLYSQGALNVLQQDLGVTDVAVWRGFPTVAAWLIGKTAEETEPVLQNLPLFQFHYADPNVFQDGRIEWQQDPSPRRTIFFGPYCVMDAGAYTLHVDGEIDGEFEVMVADHRGNLCSAILSSWTPPVIFDLPQSTWAWELIIRSTPKSRRLRIDRVGVRPTGGAVRATARVLPTGIPIVPKGSPSASVR